MAQVLFVNYNGGGLAEHRNINPGENISEFLARSLPGVDLNNYTIRLNREEVVAPGQVLQDGDRIQAVPLSANQVANTTVLSGGETISATPKRIAGAC